MESHSLRTRHTFYSFDAGLLSLNAIHATNYTMIFCARHVRKRPVIAMIDWNLVKSLFDLKFDACALWQRPQSELDCRARINRAHINGPNWIRLRQSRRSSGQIGKLCWKSFDVCCPSHESRTSWHLLGGHGGGVDRRWMLEIIIYSYGLCAADC